MVLLLALALQADFREELRPLEFLIGEWEAGAKLGEAESFGTMTFSWAVGGAFVEMHEVWKLGDLVVDERTAMIGWDAGREHITMTVFDATGASRFMVATPAGEGARQWNEPLRDHGRLQWLWEKTEEALKITHRRENRFGSFDEELTVTWKRK